MNPEDLAEIWKRHEYDTAKARQRDGGAPLNQAMIDRYRLLLEVKELQAQLAEYAPYFGGESVR